MKLRAASDFNRSIANLLVWRGKESSSISTDTFAEHLMYPKWLPASNRMRSYTNYRPFSGYEKSASLLSNSQMCIESIDSLVGKAWNMFTSHAYLHQYTKHGLNQEDFLSCFTVMENVIHDYKSLSAG